MVDSTHICNGMVRVQGSPLTYRKDTCAINDVDTAVEEQGHERVLHAEHVAHKGQDILQLLPWSKVQQLAEV